MRILFVANIRLPSEKAHCFQIMRMCAALASAGAEVTLVVPERRNILTGDPFSYYGLPTNFRLVRLKTWDTIGRKHLQGHVALGLALFSFVVAVRRFAATETPFDVCYTREGWLLPFLSRSGRKLVYEAHNLPGRGLRWYRYALGFPARVVVTSEALADSVVRLGCPRSKIAVERNGVDAEKFSIGVGVGRDEARTRLGIAASGRIVLYVGQLLAWKGLDTLLAASKDLPSDSRVVLVGGSETDIAKWKSAYPEARAEFVGQRPHEQVPLWLAAADVCVLPNTGKVEESRKYTSPIKLFEYLASGCPVVASSLPSIREIISDAEATLVAPDDPASLAAGIRTVLDRPEEAARRASVGQRLVRDRYAWDARAARIIKSISN